MFTCDYCNNDYSTEWVLKRHRKTAKFCLKLRRTKNINKNPNIDASSEKITTLTPPAFEQEISSLKETIFKMELEHKQEISCLKETISNMEKTHLDNIREHTALLEQTHHNQISMLKKQHAVTIRDIHDEREVLIEQLLTFHRNNQENIIDSNKTRNKQESASIYGKIGIKNRNKQEKNYTAELRKQQEKHAKDIGALQDYYSSQIGYLLSTCEDKIAKMEQEHRDTVNQLVDLVNEFKESCDKITEDQKVIIKIHEKTISENKQKIDDLNSHLDGVIKDLEDSYDAWDFEVEKCKERIAELQEELDIAIMDKHTINIQQIFVTNCGPETSGKNYSNYKRTETKDYSASCSVEDFIRGTRNNMTMKTPEVDCVD